MIVQWEVLEEILKDKNMNQAQLAKKSGVSENTISNWKKGKEARKSYLERVAKALGTNVARLIGTNGSEKDEAYSDSEVFLELVAHHYGVSSDSIIRMAPMLFSVVARRALKKRLDVLNNWYEKLQEAAKPPFGVKPFHDHYESVEDEVSYSTFSETYWHERERREKGDLRTEIGKARMYGESIQRDVRELPKGLYGVDLFFEELLSIDTGSAIEDFTEATANLKNWEEGEDFFYCIDSYDIPYRVCAREKWDYGSIEDIEAEAASKYLREGLVRIAQIPTVLFGRGKEKERVNWILAKGDFATKERLEARKKSQLFEIHDGDENA